MKFTMLTATLTLASATNMQTKKRADLRAEIAELKEQIKLATFGCPVEFNVSDDFRYASMQDAHIIRRRGFDNKRFKIKNGDSSGLQTPYYLETLEINEEKIRQISKKLATKYKFDLGVLNEINAPDGRDPIAFSVKINSMHKDVDIKGEEYWFGNCNLYHPGMHDKKFKHFDVVFQIRNGIFEVVDIHFLIRMPGTYYQGGKFIRCKKDLDPATYNKPRDVAFWTKLQKPVYRSSGYMSWNINVTKSIFWMGIEVACKLEMLTDELKKIEDDVKIEVIKDESKADHDSARMIVGFAKDPTTLEQRFADLGILSLEPLNERLASSRGSSSGTDSGSTETPEDILARLSKAPVHVLGPQAANNGPGNFL